LASARELQDRDPDGSVNRSYYAMFDIARAALLSAGEHKHWPSFSANIQISPAG
jgi:uncharacterized protein (UPF0332 family)